MRAEVDEDGAPGRFGQPCCKSRVRFCDWRAGYGDGPAAADVGRDVAGVIYLGHTREDVQFVFAIGFERWDETGQVGVFTGLGQASHFRGEDEGDDQTNTENDVEGNQIPGEWVWVA